MAEIHLAGYCDRFSARPGERLDIMVNAEGTDRVELQLVRLIHGDENPEGPGFVEREVDAPVNGTHAVARQHTQLGSFVRVADPDGRLATSGPFTLWANIWPRTPADGRQGRGYVGGRGAEAGDRRGAGVGDRRGSRVGSGQRPGASG